MKEKEIIIGDELKDTKENTDTSINSSEMVSVKLPLDPFNPHIDYIDVAINGVWFKIKRGIKTSVPKFVSDVLDKAGY